MAEVSIQFDPPPDVLSDLIERLQVDLKKGMEDAILLAAWYLARSLSASTRPAPKLRKYQRNTGAYSYYPASEFPQYVIVWRKSRQRMIFLRPHEAAAGKWKVIKRSGLAKQSWIWMMSALGMPERTAHARIPSATSVRKFGDANNPGWEMINKLNYIETAVRLGRKPISDAFGRAVRAGNLAIDRRLAKAKK